MSGKDSQDSREIREPIFYDIVVYVILSVFGTLWPALMWSFADFEGGSILEKKETFLWFTSIAIAPSLVFLVFLIPFVLLLRMKRSKKVAVVLVFITPTFLITLYCFVRMFVTGK